MYGSRDISTPFAYINMKIILGGGLMANVLIKTDREYSVGNKTLYPYQVDAVEHILSKFNVILNLQPGSGKTFVSLCAMYRCISCSKDLQVAILCPKQAVSSFKKELKSMNLSYNIHTAEETINNPKARIHIFVFSKIDELIKFCYEHEKPIALVVDECHKLTNKNKGNDKLFQLRKRFSFVVGLSGTPLQNNPAGIFNVINFVSPGFLGSYTEFSNRFLKLEPQYIKIYGKRQKAMKVVGLKESDVLATHLSKIVFTKVKEYTLDFQYRSCYMTDEERKEYVKHAKGIQDDSLDEKAFSARLHDLQRVVDGSLNPKPHLSSKEKLLISTLSEVMSRGESTLVYCEYETTYTRLVDILTRFKHLINYSQIHLITGKIKFEDRVKVETNMPPKSIVIMTKAGSASINLQAANNIIFYSTPFGLSDLIQAIGRITRVDTKYPIQHVYFLEVTDTIDTYRRTMVESKVSYLTQLFGAMPTLPQIEEVKINLKELKRNLLWKKY